MRIKSTKPKALPAVAVQRVVRWLRQKLCRHVFRYDDLLLTGIKEQERPAENATYKEWMEWFQNRDKEPAFTKRVSWPCVKCGRTFYGQCGLEIMSHGKLMPPNNVLCGRCKNG
jgi:hypothetical protein